MSISSLDQFKRTTIGHYIDHCNQRIDNMTREVFSSPENPAKAQLIKIFNVCMKELADFLKLSSKERTKDNPFPKFTIRVCLRNHPSILRELEQLKLTLVGETDCDFPLPLTRITSSHNEQTHVEPLALEDQQNIQTAICLGLQKKVSTLREQLSNNSKSLEDDAKAAAIAKAKILELESENKRKADELHSIFKRASTREGAFELVQENPMNLKHLGALKDDLKLVKLAISIKPESFQFASPRLRKNPALIKFLLQQENSDHILEFIDEKFRQDKEAVLKMIRHNELALCHAGEDLYDLDFLLESLLENPMSYQVLEESLRKDKQIFDLFMRLILMENFRVDQLLLVLPQEFHALARAYFTVEDNPTAWKSLPSNIKNDRALIMFYYDQYFDDEYHDELIEANLTDFEGLDFRNFLNNIPESQKNFARSLFGLDFVAGYTYGDVEENLKDDVHIAKTALATFPEGYDLILEKFKDSDFYIKFFLNKAPSVYTYLPENKKKIPSIARIALSQDLSLLALVPHPLNENADFILEILEEHEEDSFEFQSDAAIAFLKALTPSVRSNPLVISSAIRRFNSFYENLNEAERNTKAYAMAVLEARGFKSYKFLPEALKSDPDIILKAVEAHVHLHSVSDFFIPIHLQKDQEFLLSLIEISPGAISSLTSFEVFNDEDFVYRVVRSSHLALRHLDPRFFKSTEKLKAYFLENERRMKAKALLYMFSAIEKKYLDADFLSTILKNHDDVAIEILNNKIIHRDLRNENSVCLGFFRRFFLKNRKRFAFFAQKEKEICNMSNELLLDLIGQDVRFFFAINNCYKTQNFFIEAIKKNSEVYELGLNEAGKNNPVYKAARALSVPYFRPLP